MQDDGSGRKRRTSCDCGDCKRCHKREYDRRRYFERREDVLARGKAWNEANKERKAEYDRQYRAEKGEERLAAKRAYYAENRDEIREKQRVYQAENLDRILERSREYYVANREEIRRKTKEYQVRNREKIVARVADWRRRNPEKVRLTGLAHQHRRRGAPYTEAGREYAETVLPYDPCSYCGAPAVSVDHIDPIVAGGDGDFTNLTAACLSCNSRKNARPLLVFLVERLAEDTLRAAA